VTKHGWLWAGILLVGGVVGVWFSLSNPKAVERLAGTLTKLSQPISGEDGEIVAEERKPEARAEEEESSVHLPDPDLSREVKGLAERFRKKPDRDTALRLLQEFTARMFAANPDRAAAALLQFLRSGEDNATGLEFAVGEAGLEEWPSLRAFLLDLLGKIDPALASRYALEAVIPAKNSTVEYAVSLQILWNHGGAEKPTPELTSAWLGLLQKPDWAARPDAAWLESLDFGSRIPEETPRFLAAATPWLARPGEAAGKAEAAEMALERMMVRHPRETLAGLLQNPQWMDEGRGPAVRATAFARVDTTESEQVLFLRTYLQGLDPRGSEAAAFYRAFPCYNYGVAPGLSGQPEIPGAADIEARLRADLALLENWQKDPGMAVHRAWLEEALVRVRDTLGPSR